MGDENQVTSGRREFLKRSVGTAFVVGCLGARAEAAANMLLADTPATHNMLIVGRQTVFLSHLPMFSGPEFISPHRYQVLVEATFMKSGSNPQALYADDRKANPGTKIYTLSPEEFVLPNLGAQTLTAFKAKIFRGHLEKGGSELLAENVQVNITRVIHFHEFNPAGDRPAQLQYIIFGKGDEVFLAHFIAAPPDFDQVLSVKITNRHLTDVALGNGVRITVNRPNTIGERVRENQQVKAVLPLTRDPAVAGQEIEIKAETELYLEEGELRVPADFKTTEEERAAGFR